MTVQLIRTISKDYYIDKSLVTNCDVNSKRTFQIFKNQTDSFKLNDLCMFSTYNVSIKTILTDYETVEYSSQFRTGIFNNYSFMSNLFFLN